MKYNFNMTDKSLDNIIITKGATRDNIEKVLQQWISDYIDSLQDGLAFEIYKNGEQNILVKADIRLSNIEFFILIDYLKYPRGIKNNIQIEGFTTVQADNILKGQSIFVQIPTETDDYGHSAYLLITTNEGKSYKIDFWGKIKGSNGNGDYKHPDDFTFQNPDILTVHTAEYAEEIKERADWKIGKRFKPIALIALIILLIGHVFFSDHLNEFLLFFGLGLWAWFMNDYKMLQSNKYYMYCLAISVVFCGYGTLIYILAPKQKLGDASGILISGLFSLLLLLVQYPTRKIYKTLFNREPVIERRMKRFADYVYLAILIFVPFFSIFAIISLLK
jgi:hypothetical protein